jgi:hypothetical protein
VIYYTPCQQYVYAPYEQYGTTITVVAPLGYAVSQAPVAQPIPQQNQHEYVSPSGKRYVVTVSDEPGTEEKLKQERAEELRKLSPLDRAQAASNIDFFVGHDRKAAKTSIATGGIEAFSTLGDLLNTLVDDQSMLNHNPPITKDADSERVAEEQRNVTVSAFIYALKSESDNDFHMILGTDGSSGSTQFMNAEISGLPRTGPALTTLKAVRDKFKAQFDSDPISDRYHKFNPPIPVQVTGSTFYDVDHAPGVVGPTGMRPATSWEIHPVTNIDFGP